jgi:hypothetical protein
MPRLLRTPTKHDRLRSTISLMIMNRTLARVVLVACLCVAVFVLAYPIYVIRPFRAQGATELAGALVVRSSATLLSGVAAALAIAVTALSWRRLQRTSSRVVTATLTALTVLFASLTHVNVYERMFHRIDSPDVLPASEAKLDADDMVLAVRSGGHARAYPIRMMGYHHIVNDSIGGVPVVATY